MDKEKLNLPFSDAEEFVAWARKALERKREVTDKVQRDWDKCHAVDKLED